MSKASKLSTIFGAAMIILSANGSQALCAEEQNANHFAGLANYYADSFHGKRTASGERHDKTKLMCAHRTLFFGTKLKVVNKWNGRSTVVVVNDRGPFTRGHIIDLSYEAARQIGSIRAGTAPVDCYIVKDEKVIAKKAACPVVVAHAPQVQPTAHSDIVSRADDLNAFKLDFNGQIAETIDAPQAQ